MLWTTLGSSTEALSGMKLSSHPALQLLDRVEKITRRAFDAVTRDPGSGIPELTVALRKSPCILVP